MSSPVSITIPARIVLSNIHGHTLTVVVNVRDTGSLPLQITASQSAVTKLAIAHPASGWVTSLTPASFTLRPGATQPVTITMTVPAGAGGQHALNAIFRALPADATGNIATSAAVADTILVDLPGKDTSTGHAPPLVLPSPPGSFPAVPVAAGSVGLVVVALAAVVATRLRRGRGSHHAQTRTARHAA